MHEDVPFNRLNGIGAAPKTDTEVITGAVERAVEKILNLKYGIKPKKPIVPMPQATIARPNFFQTVRHDGTIGPDWLKIGALAVVVGAVGWRFLRKRKR